MFLLQTLFIFYQRTNSLSPLDLEITTALAISWSLCSTTTQYRCSWINKLARANSTKMRRARVVGFSSWSDTVTSWLVSLIFRDEFEFHLTRLKLVSWVALWIIWGKLNSNKYVGWQRKYRSIKNKTTILESKFSTVVVSFYLFALSLFGDAWNSKK
jgi:hypothetical protein